MICEFQKDTKKMYVKFEGEIDHHTCQVMKKELDYEIQKSTPRKLIFDFENVKFMDSSGIGLLIGRYKTLLRIGAKAEIINVSKEVKRILDMSGIFKIMQIKEEIA